MNNEEQMTKISWYSVALQYSLTKKIYSTTSQSVMYRSGDDNNSKCCLSFLPSCEEVTLQSFQQATTDMQPVMKHFRQLARMHNFNLKHMQHFWWYC